MNSQPIELEDEDAAITDKTLRIKNQNLTKSTDMIKKLPLLQNIEIQETATNTDVGIRKENDYKFTM